MTVITDRGTEFQGKFTATCDELLITHERVAVNSSWQNGKIERVHNTLNNWLRARLIANVSAPVNVRELISMAEDCVEVHNTTMSESTGVSPHSLMFTFPSFIYDEMREMQPRVAKQWFPHVSRKSSEKTKATFQEKDPKQNESWLVANTRTKGKLNTNRHFVCKILKQLGPKIFRIQVIDSKDIYVHRKALKMMYSPKIHKKRHEQKEKQRKAYLKKASKAKKVKKTIEKKKTEQISVGETKTTAKTSAKNSAAGVRFRSKSTTRVVAMMLEEKSKDSASRPTKQRRLL
jgi:hypothetical protein